MKPISDKEREAVLLRASGRTFRDIAKQLGISASAVQRRCNSAAWKIRHNRLEQQRDTLWGLGVVASNVFVNHGIRTRTAVAEGVYRGTIKPGFARWYGPTVHLGVLDWLDETERRDA